MSVGVTVRRLRADDAASLVSLRREALETDPLAFGASVEDDHALSLERVRSSLADSREQAVFGCFEGDDLVGMVGVHRASKLKQRHIAIIWGMYVTARARHRGGGRALLDAAIQQAREWGLEQVQLSVTDPALSAKRLYEAAGFRSWGHEPRSLHWQGRFVGEHHLILDLRTPADVADRGVTTGDEIGLFEAMYTQRALRYIAPDPIPDALIRRVVDAGIRAPNGGNQQRWRFIVIKDPATKRWIQERYRHTDRPAHAPPRNQDEAASMARNDDAANHLAAHLHEVPVLILCCLQHDGSPSDINRGASIYPAVQNMLLAARGLGLASVLTTRPRRGFEREIKERLRIPENVDTAALLPLGYPAAGYRYGSTRRRPVEDVTFDETWGRRWAPGSERDPRAQ